MKKLRMMLSETKVEELLKDKSYSELTDKEKVYILDELVVMVKNKVYSNKFLVDTDRDTIIYAKEIGRKYKVPYQDILSGIRPSGALRTKVWDSTGKIIPWEKLYGR